MRQIIKSLDPALVTLAHQGAAAYREEFDLLYRREATHPKPCVRRIIRHWMYDPPEKGGSLPLNLLMIPSLFH